MCEPSQGKHNYQTCRIGLYIENSTQFGDTKIGPNMN